jgi:hypothetical protein
MSKQRKDAAQAKTLIGATTDRALIRELFAKRVPSYDSADVQRPTRSTQAEIDAAIEAGAIDAARSCRCVAG